jgi:hypothetical protein
MTTLRELAEDYQRRTGCTMREAFRAVRDDCSCDVRPARHFDAYGRSIGGYGIYMSQIEDETRFDDACPYHGDGGSMVANFSRPPRG